MCEFFSEIEVENSDLEKLASALKEEVENFQLGEELPQSPRLGPPTTTNGGKLNTAHRHSNCFITV